MPGVAQAAAADIERRLKVLEAEGSLRGSLTVEAQTRLISVKNSLEEALEVQCSSRKIYGTLRFQA